MSKEASLIFYLTLFLLSGVLVFLGNRTSFRKVSLGFIKFKFNPYLIIAILIPVLIAGYRSNVGTDYSDYLIEYNTAIQSGSYLEIGFNIIAMISNNLFGSPVFMFTVFSALTVVPVLLAINISTDLKKNNRWLFWLLFLFIVFPQTLNLLRQGAAVSIGFLLLVSIIKRKKIFILSHVVYFLIAVSLHTSAWLLLPFSMIARKMDNNRKRSIIIFIVICSLVVCTGFFVLPQILNIFGSWVGYLEKSLVSRSVIPRSLLIIFVLGLCAKYYTTLKLSNSYIALMWMGLIFNTGGLFIAYFERTGYYTTLLIPLLVLVIVMQFTTRTQKSLMKLIILLFGILYFVVVYYLMGSSDIFPYNFSIE